MRDDLEKFRSQYELKHGPTDLTRRYTSVWPIDQQKWLLAHEPVAYFNGLPPFVQGYIKEQIKQHIKEGNLDALPESYVNIYLKAHSLKLRGWDL